MTETMRVTALRAHREAPTDRCELSELSCRWWAIRAHAKLQELPSTAGATVQALRDTAPPDGRWTMLDYLLAEEVLLVLLAAVRLHHDSGREEKPAEAGETAGEPR